MAVAAWIFVIRCAPGGGFRVRWVSAIINDAPPVFRNNRKKILHVSRQGREKPELTEFRQQMVTLIL